MREVCIFACVKFILMHPRNSVLGLRCAPIARVRIGMIGLGRRGRATLSRYRHIDGVEFRALADSDPAALEQAAALLRAEGRSVPESAPGSEAWRGLCRRDDIDLIYICTDWKNHAAMAVEAMRCGKHVAVEVPAATSVDECRALVRTAEATRRHCFMTENCCYDWFSLATRELHRRGFFGTVTHCEGAYIHDWRAKFSGDSLTARHYLDGCRHGGNPYPTHAIGPIAHLLGFHRRDRMVSLCAVTGAAAGADSPLGHVCTALITTERGVTILLQFDGTTPRPYSRMQTICGTAAFAQKYPSPVFTDDADAWHGEAAKQHLLSTVDSPELQLWREGKALGVENAMNYAMDRRFIDALRHGRPLDIDVYDAAEWSCLAELTLRSAECGGRPVPIPDFLREA